MSNDQHTNLNPTSTPSSEDLKAAFKAFKKRLKLTQLEQDSKISSNPLTGRRSTIVAIVPPTQFSREIWEELVRQGKLKKAGSGMYELGEKA
jgi:hypothetical protein